MTLKSDQVAGEQGRAALRAALFVHRRAPLSRVLARRGLGPYRGYGELLEALDRLADRGAQLSLLGRSVRGEPLLAVHLGGGRGTPGGRPAGEIGAPEGAPTEGAGGRLANGRPAGAAPLRRAHADGAAAPGERQRTTVILSGIHPLEWIGIEAHIALLDRLAAVDLGGRSVVAVPIVNPDGLLRVEMNLRAGRHRYVRNNARGVDLNRNFDVRWHDRGLAQRLLGFLFSPGSRPASEPEIEAIAHALSSRRIDRALSLHSSGGAVIYPPANGFQPVADVAEHRVWARRIARAADRKPYRALSCVRFAWGVRQTGLELDWFHDRHGALSLVVECSRGGLALSPSRLVEPFAWYNPPRVDDVVLPLVDALFPFARGARS
jgi:Zinc carboxypeptidase